jgi:hypothetical protein
MDFFARLILLCWVFCIGISLAQNFKDGDIIFQSSLSQQSKAVEEATNSPFSHCGIIFYENGKAFVYEAVQPVGKRNLNDWITSGVSKEYAVMRLTDSSLLTKENLREMCAFAKSQFGKNYDIYFGWNDKEWYCSELVWKTYYNILSIELAKPKALKEFNIDAPIVRKTMEKRYGNNIPYDEKMISPGQLFESKLLHRVK